MMRQELRSAIVTVIPRPASRQLPLENLATRVDAAIADEPDVAERLPHVPAVRQPNEAGDGRRGLVP